MADGGDSGGGRCWRYVLEGREPRPEPDMLAWAAWMETPGNRIVRQVRVGQYFVSTVFLGLDHGFGSGPPILFETMVFCFDPRSGKDLPSFSPMRRYRTWAAAEAGHREALRAVNRTRSHAMTRRELYETI